MCFSAVSSFTVAGLTGATGLLALWKAPNATTRPVAAIPLLFGVQQALEGVIWLRLGAGLSGEAIDALSSWFILIGEAVWPLYLPLAFLLVEPSPVRRLWLIGFSGLGALLFLGFSFLIFAAEYEARICGHAICYDGFIRYASVYSYYPFTSPDVWKLSGLDWTVIPYAITTIGAAMLSSHLYIHRFGLFGAIGLVASLAFYRLALVSVWCFFAALCSLFLLGHVYDMRRRDRD